ncbi:hypothetical protein HYY74_05255 [Candidatus Woesearchaeota archaeon]|nr:hypothetical protein [Candidatus Woesearchaeota archaeon]
METLQIKKSDFSKILETAELLISEVEQALSQDDIVKARMGDIKAGRVNGKSEQELDEYLKRRGVKIV